MPILIDRKKEEPILSRAAGAIEAIGDAGADCLEVALLNNMPDAALLSTERQFIDLLNAASGERLVRLHFFSLPEIARGDVAHAHLDAHYSHLALLLDGRLDALIVTGNEPRAALLSEEPYWPSLTRIIDWAEHNTISALWSCLAAHAAVLHLDGVPRHPCSEKRSGVYDCVKATDDGLLGGAPEPLRIAHSRWNDLDERELTAHGYRVLSKSPQIGVDMFAKNWRSLFVFFQGHPEYDADSLWREYRRDMGRFLRGERARLPAIPQNYFDRRSEQVLVAFSHRADSDRGADLMASFPADLTLRPGLLGDWRAPGTQVLRNWLAYIAEEKS